MKRLIPISSLELSEENPRLNVFDNSLNLISLMLDDQQQKIFKLAEDILINGTNPLDTIAVYPTDNERFKVAEGNRRVTAMMILNDPKVIQISHPEMFRKFKQLVDNSSNKPPLEIECYVYDSFDDPKLQHWIEIRHLGLSEGRGIDSWNSNQKERYRKRQYGISALMDFWQQLSDKKILSIHQIKSISKTNWERILGKKGMTYLGLERSPRNYIIPSENGAYATFVQKIKVISEKLANQTVAIVYDKDKIQQLLDEVNNELYGKPYSNDEDLFTLVDLLDGSPNNCSNDPLDSDIIIVPPEQKLPMDSPEDNSLPHKKPNDMFSNCRTVIPYKYILKTSNNRITNIISELKSLEVETNPNSCGALCRLLFELSAKHYIFINNLSSEKSLYEIDFITAITLAANDLKSKSKLTKQSYSALKLELDHIRLLFNGYMHNNDIFPSSSVIRTLFISHKEFIQGCLEK
ncbi:MAG: hypothetical protein AB7E23_03355 [Bacilli bacterium]